MFFAATCMELRPVENYIFIISFYQTIGKPRKNLLHEVQAAGGDIVSDSHNS